MFVCCSLSSIPARQAEARRFEEAIVSESTKNGRQGIIALPGVREIMQNVRAMRVSTFPI